MYLRPYQESVRINLVLVISSKTVNLFGLFSNLFILSYQAAGQLCGPRLSQKSKEVLPSLSLDGVYSIGHLLFSFS